MANNKLSKSAPAWHAEAIEILAENAIAIHETFIDSTKKAVWLGLCLIHVKTRGKEDKSIPHGEFGPWLKRSLPSLSWDTCCTYMRLARDVSEKGKFQISDFLNFAEAGDLPPSILKIIDGKTQQQLFLEFKQARIDEDGNVESVRGRSPGEGGFHGHKTLEQRRQWVMSRVGHAIKELDKVGEELLLLDDNALTVALSDLERRTKLIHHWLKTPLGKRDVKAAKEFWKTL